MKKAQTNADFYREMHLNTKTLSYIQIRSHVCSQYYLDCILHVSVYTANNCHQFMNIYTAFSQMCAGCADYIQAYICGTAI